MKTLILVAHSDVKQSGTQQFLYHQLPNDENITWHEIPDATAIDVTMEQALLRNHDRIIFQFPLYWYSVPVNLRAWQDCVLTRGFAYGTQAALRGKQCGIVVSLGDPLSDYQAGGAEHFTISELLKPMQAMALKLGWEYIKPLVISQFAYLSDAERLKLIIRYQQYLTMTDDNFNNRQEWFLNMLQQQIDVSTNIQKKNIISAVYNQIAENADELAELKWVVDLIRDEEE